MKSLFAALAALSLSACTMLSAEAPIFSAADHAAEFAPPEGLWVIRDSSDCRVNPARSRPERDTCLDWYRVRRAEDGTWRVTALSNDDPEEMRVVVMAAAPKRPDEPLASLYVGEFSNAKNADISYFALVPRGGAERPLSRLGAAGIECFVVHGEWGEIPGIVVRREDDKVVGCTATAKDGLREAARRAAVAALPGLPEQELVFVRR